MENHLLEKIDNLIAAYKKNHKGEPPLYVIVSPEDHKELIPLIKAANNYTRDQIVTSYKDIKIAEHPNQVQGKIYVSNELPETGS